ncbi:glycosyltransferase family 4 protein [Gaoshiqia sediminis]|uniref:Glycosyltransferase family 4 protein n=1 Tax=Gaoshiqia sediminis TaxID=2986998 RepID=A0AA42C9B8_9BACT|nr:glycosyltransferase family 4 protein [Gaoshiqia sediminis]MCW0481940.1 glycosyltransferase family 4 protein [Gaoshiqia sediminis]
MRVLMFGWEFPPNISGGLGTACLGITKALTAYADIDLTFVVPKAYGNEETSRMEFIGANEIDLIKSKINQERLCDPYTYISVQSGMLPYVDPVKYAEVIQAKSNEAGKDNEVKSRKVTFTGKYGADLLTEIHNYSIIGEYIAKSGEFDLIHAHDWLTYPAGVLAKKATGKPLVIHVHATDFDRSGGHVNPDVFWIEKQGMEAADAIISVSNHTKRIIVEKYGISPEKIYTVHNGVEPVAAIANPQKKEVKTVTFLGRITLQKGPQYFIEVARKVLQKMESVEFVMAGSGDMTAQMVAMVNKYGLTDKFQFPGFLCGEQVQEMYTRSDVYIMPSVSEPFGIAPLEAMHCRVPVIISKQSGVSEVVKHAIAVDFWDTDAMADAVYSILKYSKLKNMMVKNGTREVGNINWDQSAKQLVRVYDKMTKCA